MLDKLTQINTELKASVPDLNFGGCAYYAALLDRRLTELGHHIDIGAISYRPPEGANHIFTIIKINNVEYFHDGHRTTPLSRFWGDYDRLYDDPSRIAEDNRWNEFFDLNEAFPLIVAAIENAFGSFERKPHFHNHWTGEIAA